MIFNPQVLISGCLLYFTYYRAQKKIKNINVLVTEKASWNDPWILFFMFQ